ncbi:MAG: ABC transporter permease, partial [Pseudonocardiaceae bacterium]
MASTELAAPPLGPANTDAGWRSAARRRAGTPRGRWGLGRARARLAVGVVTLVGLVAAALLVPWWGELDQSLIDYSSVRLAPSAQHPFGTDAAGRDVLLRSLAGLRVSLLVAVLCAVISTLLGAVVGALSGVLGGWPDRLLMRVVDTINSVPHLLL